LTCTHNIQRIDLSKSVKRSSSHALRSYKKEILHYRSRDEKHVGALETYKTCVEFIAKAFTETADTKVSCLVHCARGRSRSTSVVLAYMIIKKGWCLKRAYLHCKKARPFIGPGAVMRPGLIALEFAVHKQNSLTYGAWRELETEIWGNPATLDEEIEEIERERLGELKETEQLKQTEEKLNDRSTAARIKTKKE